MIRRSEEKITETRKMFGGKGEGMVRRILNGPDEMYGKGQNYASKQEVDDRAKDFINKVGCFPKIEK